MPADRRTRAVLVDARHDERVRLHSRPGGHLCADCHEEFGNRTGRESALVVRQPEKRDTTARNNAMHLEVRELDAPDVFEKTGLFVRSEKVRTILKSVRN